MFTSTARAAKRYKIRIMIDLFLVVALCILVFVASLSHKSVRRTIVVWAVLAKMTNVHIHQRLQLSHEVQIWDVAHMRELRTKRFHSSLVAALAGNAHLFTTGSCEGSSHNHDVRVLQYHVISLSRTQMVCDLQWNSNETKLASGASNNAVCVWEAEGINRLKPRNVFTAHTPSFKQLNSHLVPKVIQSLFVKHKGSVAQSDVVLLRIRFRSKLCRGEHRNRSCSQLEAAKKSVRSWSCDQICSWLVVASKFVGNRGLHSWLTIQVWNSVSVDSVTSIDIRSEGCFIISSLHGKELVHEPWFFSNQPIVCRYPSSTCMADNKDHTSRVLYKWRTDIFCSVVIFGLSYVKWALTSQNRYVIELGTGHQIIKAWIKMKFMYLLRAEWKCYGV